MLAAALFAWTAAYAIVIALGLIVFLVAFRLMIVCFTRGRVRTVFDVIFALIGLAIATLLLWE
jgi:hypothetical protein